MYPFAEEGEHPVVIVSPAERCANADFQYVNGLFAVLSGLIFKSSSIMCDSIKPTG
jgi:hypothetical protein